MTRREFFISDEIWLLEEPGGIYKAADDTVCRITVVGVGLKTLYLEAGGGVIINIDVGGRVEGSVLWKCKSEERMR